MTLWSNPQLARDPVARAIVNTARITWLLFVLVAAVHLYAQHQFQKRLLGDVLDLTLAASEARTGEHLSALRDDLSERIAGLETRVDILTEAVRTPEIKSATASPTSRAAKAGPGGGH